MGLLCTVALTSALPYDPILVSCACIYCTIFWSQLAGAKIPSDRASTADQSVTRSWQTHAGHKAASTVPTAIQRMNGQAHSLCRRPKWFSQGHFTAMYTGYTYTTAIHTSRDRLWLYRNYMMRYNFTVSLHWNYFCKNTIICFHRLQKQASAVSLLVNRVWLQAILYSLMLQWLQSRHQKNQ